jgi:hypothetical protein
MPTVMPDSTFPPGEPAILRDAYRRVSEPGFGAWRRTSPGRVSAATTGEPRAQYAANGPVARGERVEPRWRDIQWVDFANGADGALPSARKMNGAEPARRAAPWIGNGADHFAMPIPTPPHATGDTVSGFLPRAVLQPAPQLSPVAAPLLPESWRVPEIVGFSQPKPQPAPRDTLEETFPAAVTTPVSNGPTPREPTLRDQWRPVLSARIAGAGVALRGASGVVAATATNGFARARTVLRPLPSVGRRVGLSRLATLSLPSSPLAPLSRHLARSRNRRRLGSLAFAMAVVVLAGYGGRVLLTRVTDDGAAEANTASVNGAPDAVIKQPAPGDKVVRAAPTAPATSASPNGDAAARAAVYVARAKAGDATAQYDVGVFYARGDGLVQDYASAASWFHAAAAQGNVAAEYNLGVLYGQGLGVAKDKTAALNWYRSAADQNHPAAQFNLALAYAAGNGTKQDFATAARWYQRAAEQGLAPAMVNLAILFEQGNGIDRSLVDAYAWYSAAAERGDNGAKERAAALFQQFNDKDKARAQGLAATIGAALDTAAPPA